MGACINAKGRRSGGCGTEGSKAHFLGACDSAGLIEPSENRVYKAYKKIKKAGVSGINSQHSIYQ